ncbi:MAG: hypothetical protein ACT4OK_06255 [Gemmobacter sp.]
MWGSESAKVLKLVFKGPPSVNFRRERPELRIDGRIIETKRLLPWQNRNELEVVLTDRLVEFGNTPVDAMPTDGLFGEINLAKDSLGQTTLTFPIMPDDIARGRIDFVKLAFASPRPDGKITLAGLAISPPASLRLKIAIGTDDVLPDDGGPGWATPLVCSHPDAKARSAGELRGAALRTEITPIRIDGKRLIGELDLPFDLLFDGNNIAFTPTVKPPRAAEGDKGGVWERDEDPRRTRTIQRKLHEIVEVIPATLGGDFDGQQICLWCDPTAQGRQWTLAAPGDLAVKISPNSAGKAVVTATVKPLAGGDHSWRLHEATETWPVKLPLAGYTPIRRFSMTLRVIDKHNASSVADVTIGFDATLTLHESASDRWYDLASDAEAEALRPRNMDNGRNDRSCRLADAYLAKVKADGATVVQDRPVGDGAAAATSQVLDFPNVRLVWRNPCAIMVSPRQVRERLEAGIRDELARQAFASRRGRKRPAESRPSVTLWSALARPGQARDCLLIHAHAMEAGEARQPARIGSGEHGAVAPLPFGQALLQETVYQAIGEALGSTSEALFGFPSLYGPDLGAGSDWAEIEGVERTMRRWSGLHRHVDQVLGYLAGERAADNARLNDVCRPGRMGRSDVIVPYGLIQATQVWKAAGRLYGEALRQLLRGAFRGKSGIEVEVIAPTAAVAKLVAAWCPRGLGLTYRVADDHEPQSGRRGGDDVSGQTAPNPAPTVQLIAREAARGVAWTVLGSRMVDNHVIFNLPQPVVGDQKLAVLHNAFPLDETGGPVLAGNPVAGLWAGWLDCLDVAPDSVQIRLHVDAENLDATEVGRAEGPVAADAP